VFVSGWLQALTLLLAVIPGFIYQGTRSQLRGPTPDEREVGVRILRVTAVRRSGVLTGHRRLAAVPARGTTVEATAAV
jgi:hypothetical protein